MKDENSWEEIIKDIIKLIFLVVGRCAVILCVSAFGGWVFMTLWNVVIPSIFGLPLLDFDKAWTFTILLGIISSYFNSSSSTK